MKCFHYRFNVCVILSVVRAFCTSSYSISRFWSLSFSLLNLASFSLLKAICIWFPLQQLRTWNTLGDLVGKRNWRRQSHCILQRLWIIQLLTTVTSLATILCSKNRNSLDGFLLELKNQESLSFLLVYIYTRRMWEKSVFSFSCLSQWNSLVFSVS